MIYLFTCVLIVFMFVLCVCLLFVLFVLFLLRKHIPDAYITINKNVLVTLEIYITTQPYTNIKHTHTHTHTHTHFNSRIICGMVLHDWYNKGRGRCYPCEMMHIKEPLLLI